MDELGGEEDVELEKSVEVNEPAVENWLVLASDVRVLKSDVEDGWDWLLLDGTSEELAEAIVDKDEDDWVLAEDSDVLMSVLEDDSGSKLDVDD